MEKELPEGYKKIAEAIQKALDINSDYNELKEVFKIGFYFDFDTTYRFMDYSLSLILNHINITTKVTVDKFFINNTDLVIKHHIESLFYELQLNGEFDRLLNTVELKNRLDSQIPNKAPETKRKTKI